MRVYLFCVVLAVGLSIAKASLANDQETYTLARAPQKSASTLYKAWRPLTEYLTKETGVNIVLKVYGSRKEFERDLVKGGPDFIYMNPYYYLIGRKKQGYISLVRSNAKKLKGILVTRKDGPYNSVKDLQGAKIAFPSPNALAASLLMRAQLFEKEKINIKPLYVGTHDNVYRTVLFGKAVAGGGVIRTLMQESPQLRDRLRTIYETPPMAAHPLCAHKRVPESLRKKITQAVLDLHKTEEGRRLLGKVKLKEPVITDHQRDYHQLDLLQLHRFSTFK